MYTGIDFRNRFFRMFKERAARREGKQSERAETLHVALFFDFQGSGRRAQNSGRSLKKHGIFHQSSIDSLRQLAPLVHALRAGLPPLAPAGLDSVAVSL